MNNISAGVQSRHFSSVLRSLLFSSLLFEGVVLLLAAALRLWMLDLKPAHFDEGINGWFVDQMKVNGFYRYDPENYHGPFYFYVLFVSLTLLGRNLWALRLPAVVASLASVWMVLRFDRYLGSVAARLGSLALAISPAAVFYGRYGIHESWLVLALLIILWGGLGLWKEGDRHSLVVLSCGVALLFLLKETAVIHVVCFFLASAVFVIWQRLIPCTPSLPRAARRWSNRDLFFCCAGSLFALIFFYSGTFLNWHGVYDFFAAYAKWFHTGTGDGGHVKTEYQLGPVNYYWLALMGRYEWPALAGLLYAVRLSLPVGFPNAFIMRYLAIYGVGTLVAYSVIPYKTPWCVISILWPFTLLFGCAVQEIWGIKKMRVYGAVVFIVLLGSSLWKTLQLNWKHDTDPNEPYVYVQTMPGISRVIEPVLGVAHGDHRQYAMGGQVILDSYYPLPWIFGDFTRIGYYDKLPDTLDGEFIIALASKRKAVEAHLTEPYLRCSFQLRDSMDECMVWFKEARFHDWFANPAHGLAERFVPHHS